MAQSEIEQKLRAAEDRIRNATARLTESTARLAKAEEELLAVEERRDKLAGEAVISRRAIADFERVLEQSHQELSALHIDLVRQTFDKAVEARDLALREAASALEWIRKAFEELDSRRAALERAERELRALDPESASSIPPEPGLLEAAWEGVVPLLRERLDDLLEHDLVEAASASLHPNAIEELPEHLRELARQRRSERIREGLQRQRN
jgi:hypothetical protein